MLEMSLDIQGQTFAGFHAAEVLSNPALAPIGVYAIDEQPLFRRGLAAMLGVDGAFSWLGEAASAAEALGVAHKISPDVVLLDLRMPAMDGLAALAALQPLWPVARFVIMASQLDPADIRCVVAAGASCLHKNVAPHEMLAAIRAVRRGQRVLSPAVVAAMASGALETPLRDELTPREHALLQLMAQGLDNRSIAQSLTITVPTVKFHVTNILSKLHAPNRTAAVLAALREKIILLDGPATAGGASG